MAVLVSQDEIAREIGVCRKTLQRWRERSYGPPWVRVGGQIRYDRDGLAAWYALRRMDEVSRDA